MYDKLCRILFVPLLAVVAVELSGVSASAAISFASRAAHAISTRGGTPYVSPQKKMPDGPVYSSLSVADRTPPTSTDHQSEAVVGWEDNYSPFTNAVGVWGSAMSHVKDGKVWGGFMSAYSDDNLAKDAQLIGLEVDVSNGTLPGVAPNRSKSGIQVVGIGNENTSGVEILSDGRGVFQNGINLEGSAVAADGTLIGAAGPGPYKYGIDFSNDSFTNSAVKIADGQRISLGDASMYTQNGKLMIVVPPGGVEFVDEQGNVVHP